MNQECESCVNYRVTETLQRKMCDFWKKEIDKDEVLTCIAYINKAEEGEEENVC